MRLTRRNVRSMNLWRYLAYGWIPIPQSIIPPNRPFYLWDRLDMTPYDAAHDYEGKLLDEIRGAIRRNLQGWEPIDRIGIWVSGGIDSSVLLYLTSEIVGSEKVRAYSLIFGERDESEYAKRIADWCDVKLVTKTMNPEDSIGLTDEAVQSMRSPIDTSVVLFISKLCEQDGTRHVFSALGLDELAGGYPPHVRASDADFFRVETSLLWTCQSNYVWVQLVESTGHVKVRFPHLDAQLIAFCRGLPREQKCKGLETKTRVREELRSKELIPKENIEAGRMVGTKAGFIPILKDWFERGYDDWCNENVPPKGSGIMNGLVARFLLTRGRTLEGRLQRRLRVATLNSFYRQLDEGKFSVEDVWERTHKKS